MDLAELKRDWLQAKAASVDEVDHRVADGALWLISEIESLRQQLADKDEQICGMTEMAKSSPPPWYKAEEMEGWIDGEGMLRINHIAPWIAEHLQKAFEKGWSMLGGRVLFPIPGCPHKEEVERLKLQLREECIAHEMTAKQIGIPELEAQLAQAREALKEIRKHSTPTLGGWRPK